MAFTGSATVKAISDRKVRITGVSLANGADGTIGLFGASGGAPDITLPASFNPQPYGYQGATVTLQDSISAEINPASSLGDFLPPVVTKTGTTHADFRMTLHNSFASASPNLEIYIEFHE